MIIGMHAIIYARDADADRAFVRDVSEMPATDAGHGWFIFAAPPSEVACQPADTGGGHELYLMTDDVVAEVDRLPRKGVACSDVSDEGRGLLTKLTLPDGGDLGLYQPRHPLAHVPSH